jgi:DivIVA domain-containing protein
MALERQDIERRDFPVARRGYDTGEVDAHLRRLADEIDELKRKDRSSAASVASDQVRAIVEAAEATAADIRRRAESEAGDQVRQVQEAVQSLLQRVEAMESELATLVESLRTGANRLNADLSELQGSILELRGAPVPSPAAEPVPETTAEAKLEAEPELEIQEEPADVAGGDDSEGARLIALNMALNGTPRDETDRYLADNFQLDDRGKLLDEVYARLG